MIEEEILIEELLLAYASTYTHKLVATKLFSKLKQFMFRTKDEYEYSVGKLVRMEYVDECLTLICKRLGYHHRLCKYMEYNCVRIGCDEDTLNIIRGLFHTEKKHGEEFVAATRKQEESVLLEGLANRVRKKMINDILEDL